MFDSEVEAKEDGFVADADIAVAVLGRLEDFLLVALDGDRAKFDAAVAEGKARGFFHCGYLRAKAGKPGVLCVDPRGTFTMSLAALEWMRANADYFRQAGQAEASAHGDWAEWASRLYAAPDARTDYGPN